MRFSHRSSDPPTFRSVASATAVGRVRDHNEDTVRVNENAALLLVADGMGGHAAGEVASRIAADMTESAVVALGSGLGDALVEANSAVLTAARDGRGSPGMGTTCAACRRVADGLELAWVGDSRVYRLRDGHLRRLSHDHSYVQTLVDSGMLAPEDAERHPERNILSLCIGNGELARTDVGETVHSLQPGDRVLVCSDGLTGELSDATIEDLLVRYPDDREAVNALIDAALDAGGRDNVTVIVATA
ncbi:MAG: protein phosphatase 2C domain-containing protein [Halofilum sp. (in: g-proteobacteria)]|nr:protein phosphatase 2C domain-containing protein [Halofilum sp. (in: g-proteobacteria)]